MVIMVPKFLSLSSLAVVLTLLLKVESWSGHVCTRRTFRYYIYYNYCYWYYWRWCYPYAYGWVYRPYYYYQNYCCPGWSHNGNQVCNIPVCSPRCQNGGTCISPNTCQCRTGYEGDICAGRSACSHVSPCYPGRCYLNNGRSECMCSQDFSGPTCLRFEGEEYKPDIEKVNATFAYYSYSKNEYAYEFLTDATGKTETDFLWINQDEFNKVRFDIDASFNTEFKFKHIPVKPNYIGDYKFGIVNASVRVEHKKLNSGGEYVANREIFTCNEASDTKPFAKDGFECRINGTNIIQLDSGDKYTLTFNVKTGGFRDLVYPDTQSFYQRQTYSGAISQNIMEYRFDYDVPIHCIEFDSCGQDDVPLHLGEDITKEPVKSFWRGWSDNNLSGVQRYALEFWKMEYSTDYYGLREPDILLEYNPVPQYITEVYENETIEYPEYEPTEPGVYSVILEVADRANNSRYARRIVIFDKTSEVSINSDYRLYATSASEETGYIWQTTPNAEDQQTTTISVSWKKHFSNDLHQRYHFLAKVLDYSPRLSDNIKRIDYKRIDQIFDDNEGKRSKEAIENINSIVKFETCHGTESTETPTTGWTTVNPLQEHATFVLSGVDIRNGDSRQVWVKAYDVMGNIKVDSTTIYFDSSPPEVWEPTFEKNVGKGNYYFSSRITLKARDVNSGIRKLSFKFSVNRTGEITKEQDFKKTIETKEKCDQLPGTCYCIRKGECFMLNTALDIDNCWLRVPIDRVKDEVHLLEITVYNMAMLSSTTTYTIGMVDQLNGIRDYFSPLNITILKTTDTSLTISWDQPPTCYDRAGIIIRLYRPDNTTKEYKKHKDATTFDMTGLSSTTKYWFELFTKYGNDTHFVMSGASATLKVTTAEASIGFPPGGVAGLSVGFIFIIIMVVVVLLFLGRTGRLQPAKERVTQGFRTIRNTIRVRNTNSRANRGCNNRAYSTKFDDDIYYYGQMEMKNDDSVVISRKDISFEDQLTQGKFATIFLAKYYGNHLEEQTVVAKVLRDDQNQEDVMKMKAKINFYVEKVGHHKNIVDFIGSVQDDVRGPFMVLEYCEKGVLRDFLVASKENVTLELEERLFRMVFGVCLGMDYLSSKQVVHRRLAARNILLNNLYEPKITGFGPDPSEDESVGEERIPVKWTAPECMKSTQHANELSDVFSFGIVMWEIFSLGDTPYPGIQGREVPKRLKMGYKMKKPEYCDETFYKLMLKCWHYEPTKRSGFALLKSDLNSMFQEGPGDEYYYRSNEL